MSKKKILMLSDDIRTYSGVGRQAKEIIVNTVNLFGLMKKTN